ncbi:carboxypeptidase S3, penicillopeptidase S3, CPD-S3 [Hyaloscypha variabilis F]|uniref:Carboxypeptidase S3, penicillopeptidase S3, CPD-S3 n=1 Tax=Hyaloscypha variabilis (strain UAMH 11265 / GT02V1 / F) TaxID=1149755 RepID=A0A2J6QTN0_HYAVF|nr:carboxypeptidase S3, penicillopeptidase S3, CPD-S3 [Hyaloscypha variabilis F]
MVETRSTDDVRFLNNATKPFQVISLPGVPFDIGEMYAGLIPIDSKNTSRALYFVYQPTIGPPVDEATIYSLEGFFQENGRFLWQKGQFAPELNPYSWVNLTNMLWVEHLVGTGFSIREVTATSEEEVAQDFINFFQNFETIFDIKKFKIYVTGESYTGRYVPYISAAMIDKHDRTYFDLAGALTYDPCIGAFDYSQEEAVTVPFVVESQAIFRLNDSFIAQLSSLDQSCGFAEYRNKFLTFPPVGKQPDDFFNHKNEEACDVFNMAFGAALALNPCFNLYHISETCPLTPDVLGFGSSFRYTTPRLPVYFDRVDVKNAMHAPDVDWSVCSLYPVFIRATGPDDNYQSDTSLDPIQHVLPPNLDIVIITNGTLLAIQNMTWNGELGFQEQPIMPIIITEPDLMYESLFNESVLGGVDDPQGTIGHMQPENQPRLSYRHIQWVLGRVDTL